MNTRKKIFFSDRALERGIYVAGGMPLVEIYSYMYYLTLTVRTNSVNEHGKKMNRFLWLHKQ